MGQLARSGVRCILLLSLLLCAFSGTAAAVVPDYSITYTITLVPDGSALWRVEYRTLLISEQDLSDFETYTRDMPVVHLPQFRDLMEKSVAQAAVATGRHMAVSGVTGTAATQTSPTGRYGVVVYSLRWDGFARQGNELVVGDAFAGGLYLAKDDTLIVQSPENFQAKTVEPAPDRERKDLFWYGQRSFGPGEPRIVLKPVQFPWLETVLGLAVLLGGVAAFWLWYPRTSAIRDRQKVPVPSDGDEEERQLAGEELADLGDRIISMLRDHGGSMFQSDIVTQLGLPKSTVSSALNDLHARGIIVKIRKGRENLIRLA